MVNNTDITVVENATNTTITVEDTGETIVVNAVEETVSVTSIGLGDASDHVHNADEIPFDDSITELNAETVQKAIEVLDATVDLGIFEYSALADVVAEPNNIWDAVDAMDWSNHEYANGTALNIQKNHVVTFGNGSSIAYRWQGTKPRLVGIGQSPTTENDYQPIGTSDHEILVNRDSVDSHPTIAITGLDAKQASQDTATALVQTNLDTHEADVLNPHAVTYTQVGADPVGTINYVHPLDGVDPTVLTGATVFSDHTVNTAGHITGSATRDLVPADIGAEPVGALRNVREDTTPQLGGTLETRGNHILLSTSGDALEGLLGVSTDGVSLVRSTDGVRDANDSAVECVDGGVILYGTASKIVSLEGTDTRQVYCSPEGVLYSVVPPVPGWEESDSDTAEIQLNTLALWVEMPALIVTVPEDIAAGDRLDAFINIQVEERSGSRTGSISVGIGVNGAVPSVGTISGISTNFTGMIPTSLSTTTHGGVTAGAIISVWVQRESEEQSQFDLWVNGSVNPSEFIVSVPGEGGAATGAVWGGITGTLADQSDLGISLGLKSDVSHTHTQANLGIMTGFKNVLVNGNFRIDQRDFLVEHGGDWGNVGSDIFGYDRWSKEATLHIKQYVESENMVNGQYTLSWDTSTGNNGVVYDGLGTQIASGGTPITFDLTKVGAYAVKVVIPIDGVANVQLEQGAVQTTFEVRNIQQELAMCQRYFIDSRYGNTTNIAWLYIPEPSATNTNVFVTFSTSMRVTPTMTTELSLGTLTIGDINQNSFTGSCAEMPTRLNYYIADAEI